MTSPMCCTCVYPSRSVIGNILKPLVAVVTLIVAAIIAVIAATSQPTATAGNPAISMTLFVTPTAILPPTETPDLPPVAEVAALASTPTQRATEYQVIAGDTLWDIAVRFDLSLDEIIAANPSVNPDWLRPGDMIAVPLPGTVQLPTPEPIVIPTPAPVIVVDISPAVARVAADATGLRLRDGPNTAALVKLKLNGLTPLTVSGRTEDNAWLRVALADGTGGWVMARYVDMNPTDNSAPVEARPLPSFQPQPSPYVSGITDRIRAIYQAGLALGNQSNVFAVVGDSNSVNTAFLNPIDAGVYDLGDYQYLQDTIDAYRGSFRHNSVAAVVGINTTRLYDASFNDSPSCSPGETRLACEYRLKRPSVALILIGTNDVSNWGRFEANYRPLIEFTLAQGIVPILVNKGDDLESSKYGAPFGTINAVITKLSQEYGLPLADVHSAIQALPNKGFLSDGFHFNAPPGGRSVSFTSEAMNYGHTVRNLVTLQALDAVRRVVAGN